MDRLVSMEHLVNRLYERFHGKGDMVSFKDVIWECTNEPVVLDINMIADKLTELSETYCAEYGKEEGSLYLQDVIDIFVPEKEEKYIDEADNFDVRR